MLHYYTYGACPNGNLVPFRQQTFAPWLLATSVGMEDPFNNINKNKLEEIRYFLHIYAAWQQQSQLGKLRMEAPTNSTHEHISGSAATDSAMF